MGIERTVSQIYALLYLSAEPLCAEDIAGALGISRPNLSISLRELQARNPLLLRHRSGDRRDFLIMPSDVWDILRILAEERRKREADPTLTVVRGLISPRPEPRRRRSARTGCARCTG